MAFAGRLTRVMQRVGWSIPALLMPLLFSGCILSEGVMHRATNGSVEFVPDKIKSIEKAFVAPEGKLVILLDGKRAESSTNGPFTMAVPLESENDRSWVLVKRQDVTAGWDRAWLQRTDLLAVSVGPPISALRKDIPQPTDNRTTERALYPVKEKWANDAFWYVVSGPTPTKYDVVVRNNEVRRSHRYALLWLPLTIPADIILLPYEIYVLWNMGDRVAPRVAEAPMEQDTSPH